MRFIGGTYQRTPRSAWGRRRGPRDRETKFNPKREHAARDGHHEPATPHFLVRPRLPAQRTREPDRLPTHDGAAPDPTPGGL